MIFLKPLFDVVDLIGGKQSAHAENARGQHLASQAVEHALSVHEENADAAFGHGGGWDDERLAPEPDALRVAITAAFVRETVVGLVIVLGRHAAFQN